MITNNSIHFQCYGWDPGANGALCCISIDDRNLIADVDNIRFSKSSDSDVLEFIARNKAKLKDPINCFAYIERVNAMPGQGVSSTFKFGTAYGKALMAMLASGINFELVSPSQWQKDFGLTKKGQSKTEHKNALKQYAERQFAAFNQKIVLENADAFLLALYCKQHQTHPF